MKQKIYLDNTPLQEAIDTWTAAIQEREAGCRLQSEQIKVVDSLGRITAEAITARISSPFYHSSAMDGYAVRFSETFGASEGTPVRLKIPEQSVYVATGDPMPDGFNAVVMIEDVNLVRDSDPPAATAPGCVRPAAGEAAADATAQEAFEFVEIIKPVTPWQHVRTAGEDIVTTELILPENHKIRAFDIGAMLAGGFTEVTVRKKPRVVIIPTGSELVEPGSALKKGNIIESNSRILAGLAAEWGAEPIRWNIVPDDRVLLKKALRDAVQEGDLVVVNAGASAGKKDFTSSSISELGEILLHGVNIKPGKPVILGRIHDTPVIGIPGYPVSAYITFDLFAKPLIHSLLGVEMPARERLTARLSRQIASAPGIEEFVRVKLGNVGGNVIASPVSRGAGMLMSLVRADGFARIPAMSEGIGSGAEVEIELISPRERISNTLVCIGSHDNILDVLANFLKRRYKKFSLSSAHVGSMGGLIALKRGEAHLAGTHLLHEATGQYNIPFIQEILPDEDILLINLVYRQQGLFVLKGNPKNITGFQDLIRNDVTFINRQPGSGTRLLTDKYLKDLNIDPARINGYEKEEYTHMTVASAVLNGIADAGPGILAAAQALGLDFIPLAKERYDLAVPRKFYPLAMIQGLLEIIRNDTEFRASVRKLGGYDTADMGRVLFEQSP